MHKLVFAAIVLFLLVGAGAPADLRLPAVIGDNMVLQRGADVPIWGWADPGTEVTVAFAGQTKSGRAGDDGAWRVKLAPLEASSDPAEMTIKADRTITLKNILVGEVWICSGQSNMEWPITLANDSAKEIAAADYPDIRLMIVPKVPSRKPVTKIKAEWVSCSPKTIAPSGGKAFSAVGYFFGRKIHKELGVPVGLIQSAWGGTRAEPWTRRDFLMKQEPFAGALKKYEQAAAAFGRVPTEGAEARQAKLKKYYENLYSKDVGTRENWEDSKTDTSGWGTVEVPGLWAASGIKELAQLDGVAWFRRTVEIPEAWAGKPLRLKLGAIDDADATYWNGEKVGAIRWGTPRSWQRARNYRVPKNLVRAGTNVLTVRILDQGGAGGFTGKKAQLTVTPVGDREAAPLSLSGEWRYKIGWKLKGRLPPVPGQARDPSKNPNSPTTLYNGMIAPLVPFAIRGAIWYQGESNAGQAYDYRALHPLMIKSWRAAWGQGDFPFYITQLANFRRPAAEPGPSSWAELQEAQLLTARSVPNCGIAVTVDIGKANDIHPRNKQDVGLRLALWALAKDYGQKDVVCSGPLYKSNKVEGGSIRIRFDYVGSGLLAKGGPLKRFEIAGKDRTFVWADARIDGDVIVVSSDKVKAPVAVRYAWADNPAGCNLYNKDGLPASPFRTDDWPGVTAPKE